MWIRTKTTSFILCFAIYCALFILAALGMKFYYLMSYPGWMIVTSLLMFTLKHKKYQVTLAKLSVFFALSVVIFNFSEGNEVLRIAREPVSGRRFGVQATDMKFAQVKHRYIYYEYNGFFLYNPKITAYMDTSMDTTLFIVDSEGIYVNCTFMGEGALYPTQDDYTVRLDNPEITEIRLYRKKSYYTILDYFQIEKDTVTYYDTDTKSKMTVAISLQQYQEIITILESAKINESKMDDEYGYYIRVDCKDNSATSIYIDGDEIYQSIAQFLET